MVETVMPGRAPRCEPDLAEVQPSTETVTLAKAFGALGDPVRLHILDLIGAAGEMCVCDLVEPLGRAQPTVSHHVRVLREAGLVEAEKRGSWSWYRAVPGRLAELQAALRDLESRSGATVAS